MSTFTGHAPSLNIKPVPLPESPRSELTRIPCPYCQLGGTLLAVEKGGVEKIRIEGFKDPRKCDSCERYFKLNVRVAIEGSKIEGE